jgi:hypothetical protein
MLAGNLVAIFLSGIVCVVVSLIKPQNYDWALMKEIPMIESDENAFLGSVSVELGTSATTAGGGDPCTWTLGGGCLSLKEQFWPGIQKLLSS